MDQVKYVASGTRGPSQLIWKDFDLAALRSDPSLGFYKFDDFNHITSLVGTTSDFGPADHCGYNVFMDGAAGPLGASIIARGGLAGTTHILNAHGVCAFDANAGATDNEAFAIQDAGSGILLNSSTRLAAFEARVKFSSVADTLLESFIGLLESELALTTAIPITATADTMVDDKAWIAFDKLESNGDSCDFKFQENGTTSPVTAMASAAALVADTWIKLGFRLDLNEDSTRRITIFVDGVAKSTYITGSTVGGATFPNGNFLIPTFAGKARAGSDWGTASIDWWAIGQRY